MDTCPVHGGAARKEYEFGRLHPQPRVTVYTGCACAVFDAEMPGGREVKHCASYNEAASFARMALAIWRAA